MSSLVEWLNQIDATSPPSASVSATRLPPAHEFLLATFPSQSQQEELDPSSSSSHLDSNFESFQPLDVMYPYRTLLTTISGKREKGAEIRSAYRALQLARASRSTSAALLEHRSLRIHEINLMHTIAQDEYNEAITLNEDVEYHLSCVHKFDAIRAIAQEEHKEALTLFNSADLDVGKSEGTLVSIGEQIPPAFSQPASQPGS